MARFTFADDPFECCCETILATNVFCRKRYPSQKAPIKWMQNNIHLPETPSFQTFKLAFCQNFAQTSTNFLIFILKHGPMWALFRIGANESFRLRYLTSWLEPWVSSYDPKHAIGSCLNPASIEISLAEIKSEPGEGQGLRIFRLGQFSL